MWSDVVINVSGMWLRRDVKAAYVFTRAFIKEKELGGDGPQAGEKEVGKSGPQIQGQTKPNNVR